MATKSSKHIHIHLGASGNKVKDAAAPSLASVASTIRTAIEDLSAKDKAFTKAAAAEIKSGAMEASEAVRVQTKHEKLYAQLTKALQLC